MLFFIVNPDALQPPESLFKTVTVNGTDVPAITAGPTDGEMVTVGLAREHNIMTTYLADVVADFELSAVFVTVTGISNAPSPAEVGDVTLKEMLEVWPGLSVTAEIALDVQPDGGVTAVEKLEDEQTLLSAFMMLKV